MNNKLELTLYIDREHSRATLVHKKSQDFKQFSKSSEQLRNTMKSLESLYANNQAMHQCQ